MKQINDFINEKLKINSKTNSSSIAYEICDLWGLDDEGEYFKKIEDWVEKNDVTKVKPVADVETLRDASDFLSDETLELYDCSVDSTEECQYRLSKAKNLYSYKQRGEKFDIEATNDMICIIGWYGTLYCVA